MPIFCSPSPPQPRFVGVILLGFGCLRIPVDAAVLPGTCALSGTPATPDPRPCPFFEAPRHGLPRSGCFVLAGPTTRRAERAGTIVQRRVFFDPRAVLPKCPSAMQTGGMRHWDALNEAAGAAFARRNPQLAAPEPEHVLDCVPLAWRAGTKDAQYLVRRFDLTAAGPLGRNGVHYGDTDRDRVLNRPPHGMRDVHMVGAVGVPSEPTYFFEERLQRVARAQALAAEQRSLAAEQQAQAAEQQARAAERRAQRRRERNARTHRNSKARRLAQYAAENQNQNAPAEL
jgi:hypothetical protein